MQHQLERVAEAAVLHVERQQVVAAAHPHGGEVVDAEGAAATDQRGEQLGAGPSVPRPDAAADRATATDGHRRGPGPHEVEHRHQLVEAHRGVAVDHGDVLGRRGEHPGVHRGAVAGAVLA